jgi:hypothetical protein
MAARKDTHTPEGYSIIEVPCKLVLPADVAAEAFSLLCRGEPVDYDYNTKAHKRVPLEDYRLPSLRVFPLTSYAKLALTDEVE